jgi:hypothetical protein
MFSATEGRIDRASGGRAHNERQHVSPFLPTTPGQLLIDTAQPLARTLPESLDTVPPRQASTSYESGTTANLADGVGPGSAAGEIATNARSKLLDETSQTIQEAVAFDAVFGAPLGPSAAAPEIVLPNETASMSRSGLHLLATLAEALWEPLSSQIDWSCFQRFDLVAGMRTTIAVVGSVVLQRIRATARRRSANGGLDQQYDQTRLLLPDTITRLPR